MDFRFLFLILPLASLCGKPGYEAPWGKDSTLVFQKESPLSTAPQKSETLLGEAVDHLIVFYQQQISPLYPARSSFRPTSSKYMLLAIRRYGFFTGYIMGCDRLIRENKDPWVYRTRVIDNKIYKWDPTLK